MKKRLLLVGFFGWGNFGDELFLETHRQQLGDEYELVVANDLTQAPYFTRPVTELVKEVDGVIIGGGDLINPMNVSDLYWREEYLQKPVFVFGIGVPNVRRSRPAAIDHYRKFLQHENCKLVIARDVESYTWLDRNLNLGDKAAWYPDPVCSFNRPAPVQDEAKTLGVVMREHRSLDPDMSALRRLIDSAKKKDYQIRHIVLANKKLGPGDLERAHLIAKEDEEIFYSENLKDQCQAISSVSHLASIKFHGMVVAGMYGIPSIAMSVTPKNRNFLRMIERPEMLQSYTNPTLYRHLPWFPARISNRVRYWLNKESRKGYEVLRTSIAASV